MTIQQAYVADCDECEDIFEDDFDHAWITEQALRAAMRNRGWVEGDGEVLCKHCAAERERSNGGAT